MRQRCIANGYDKKEFKADDFFLEAHELFPDKLRMRIRANHGYSRRSEEMDLKTDLINSRGHYDWSDKYEMTTEGYIMSILSPYGNDTNQLDLKYTRKGRITVFTEELLSKEGKKEYFKYKSDQTSATNTPKISEISIENKTSSSEDEDEEKINSSESCEHTYLPLDNCTVKLIVSLGILQFEKQFGETVYKCSKCMHVWGS